MNTEAAVRTTIRDKVLQIGLALTLAGSTGLVVKSVIEEWPLNSAPVPLRRDLLERKNPTELLLINQLDQWQKIRVVKSGETIDSIAQEVYPRFNDNQDFYRKKILFANQQSGITPTIYFGQKLYIPHPGIPTLGFVIGDEARFGKDLYLKIEEINNQAKTVKVKSYNGGFETLLGGVFAAAGRTFKLVAILNEVPGLEGFPDLVPPRAIFELQD